MMTAICKRLGMTSPSLMGEPAVAAAGALEAPMPQMKLMMDI